MKFVILLALNLGTSIAMAQSDPDYKCHINSFEFVFIASQGDALNSNECSGVVAALKSYLDTWPASCNGVIKDDTSKRIAAEALIQIKEAINNIAPSCFGMKTSVSAKSALMQISSSGQTLTRLVDDQSSQTTVSK